MGKILLITTALLFLTNCGGGSSSSGGGTATTTNKFTASGTPITTDAMTAGYSALAAGVGPLSTSQVYYGRALMKNGSNLYGAVFHFTINKNDATTAYFSNFFLDYMVQVTGYATSSNIVTGATNLSVTAAYNATTNTISIADAGNRFVKFSIDFGNNAQINDVANAGVIFTNDFNTMVGGDNSTFFFIAQKASSMPSVSLTDLNGTTEIANFTVSGAGAASFTSTSSVVVGGTGGTGLTAFTGNNSSIGAFQGELTLNNSSTGVFMFGYDNGLSNPPTAVGGPVGAFLFSPDKKAVLGYDTISGDFFAASK